MPVEPISYWDSCEQKANRKNNVLLTILVGSAGNGAGGSYLMHGPSESPAPSGSGMSVSLPQESPSGSGGGGGVHEQHYEQHYEHHLQQQHHEYLNSPRKYYIQGERLLFLTEAMGLGDKGIES